MMLAKPLLRLILLLAAGVAVHSSMPVASATDGTRGERAVRAVVEPAIATPGESAQLHVQLNRPGGMSTILKLEITYADGTRQQVVGSTLGNAATLAWDIPADAGVGTASYRLTTGDCGCGDRSIRVQNVLPPAVVEGFFELEIAR